MTSSTNIRFTSPCVLADMPSDTPVLLAFSGGADSSALLAILAEDSRERGYPLFAAHLNHLIRGEEAERDEQFCRDLASRLGVRFISERIDVPALARASGESLEAEAREQRYRFLERTMRDNSIPILVTAHHADDQTESILLHVLRGSGIAGLRGIAPCRSFGKGGDLFLVRPLLHTEKSDLLAYCEENRIPFVTDSTNGDTSYLRNALRASVTPRLKELQPRLCDVISRLSSAAAEADSLIEDGARDILGRCERGRIPLAELSRAHAALRSRVLAIAFDESVGGSLERTHIDALLSLAERAIPHSSVSLPGGSAARIEGGALVFSGKAESCSHADFDIPLRIGEFSVDGGAIINIEEYMGRDARRTPHRLSLILYTDGDTSGMHLRPRRAGDTIRVGGMGKRIKKLMNEKKLPLDIRDRLPLLLDGDEVLWVPSAAVCDRLRVAKKEEGARCFLISIKFENNDLTYKSEVFNEKE